MTAKKPLLVTKAAAGLPNSWPEVEGEIAVDEVYIHPERGLRECSELVINGKVEEDERQTEEEQRKKYLQQIVEEKNSEWKKDRSKNISHRRQRSNASSVSGPQSPSAQRKSNGGSRMLQE